MEARDYKDTLHLPKTSFPMKADLPKREPERLARWIGSGLYEKVLAPSAPLVNKLLEDKAVDADLRARLTELGERVESTELKLKNI